MRLVLQAPDLLDPWLAAPRTPLASATQRRYRTAIRHFLNWFAQVQQRTATLADLTPPTFAGYRAVLQQTCATRTVNVHVGALHSWMAWLTDQGYLRTNPARHLKSVGQERALAPRSLSAAEVNTLLRQTQHSRYPARNTAIVQILVQSGIRIGECAALAWADIAFGERQGSLRVRAAKSTMARSGPLNLSARQALADYVAPLLGTDASVAAVAAAWPTGATRPPTPYLWHSERETILSLREMSRIVHTLMTDTIACGLLPVGTTPHSLRHTFARHYLASHPADLVGLARLLGHSSLETTRIYVEPTVQELAARVEHSDLNIYGH